MEQVILTISVRHKLDDLFDALITKGYFAIVENADTYIDNLIEFMSSIPKQQRYPNTGNNDSSWFCRFKPNRQTTWYILFDVEGETYLIKNLFNNYMPDYATFLNSMKSKGQE